MLKKVMAIIKNATHKNSKPVVGPNLKVDKAELTKTEIEFILSTLRQCTFQGTQVVELYNTVLKLQQQHKNLEEE